MDLDISATRAFVRTADLLHFRNAAAGLGISQQALSKRISKLEATLGIKLFERSTRTVRLTSAGQRFLLPARAALNAADAAVATLTNEFSPIRVDLLAEPLAPTILVDHLAKALPGLVFERSARRGVAAAITALLHGEIDLAFGRIHGTPEPGIQHDLILIEPLLVLVPHHHALAARDTVTLAELAEYGLWTQAPTIAAEWSAFASSFAEHIGSHMDFAHVDNIHAQDILDRCGDSGPVFLTASDVANPNDHRLHAIDLTQPAPTYPWSIIWRAGEQDHRVRKAITTLQNLRDTYDWATTTRTTAPR